MIFRTLCLAGACAPALAAAQGSVNLFGIIDIAISHYATQGGASVTKVISGGLQASRIGLRGTEDLGDGLRAGFWLEGDVNADSGTGGTTNTSNQSTGTAAPVAGAQGLTFGRRSTVSLSGNWGELRLGRDYVPTFWNFAAFDPFMMFGVASGSNLFFAGTAGSGLSTVRNSNSIGYLYNGASPIGADGWYGQVQYALGENNSGPANADDGRYLGARAGYASGPWNLAVASSRTRMLANGDFRTSNAGVSWESSFARLMLQYTVSNSGIAGTKYRTYLAGATIPVGSGYIPVSLMKTQRNNAAGANARQLALGYVHNLSRRTALYGTYARIRNGNGAAFVVGGSASVPGLANATSSGFDVGVRHSF
jgi:predicted porin